MISKVLAFCIVDLTVTAFKGESVKGMIHV